MLLDVIRARKMKNSKMMVVTETLILQANIHSFDRNSCVHISPASSATVKNAWSYTLSLSVCFNESTKVWRFIHRIACKLRG